MGFVYADELMESLLASELSPPFCSRDGELLAEYDEVRITWDRKICLCFQGKVIAEWPIPELQRGETFGLTRLRGAIKLEVTAT
jgi:hypothetical protein